MSFLPPKRPRTRSAYYRVIGDLMIATSFGLLVLAAAEIFLN
jgi:hypothetical protein